MPLILTKKSGIYRVVDGAKGDRELARIDETFSESQLATLNERISEMYASDSVMISKFNELVHEIIVKSTRSVVFKPVVVRTPEELFQYAGVKKLDVNIENGEMNLDIKNGGYSFTNTMDMLEFLKRYVSVEITVTEEELEMYVRELALKSGRKPEWKLQDRVLLPESDINSFLSRLPNAIKRLKLEDGEYHVEYRHDYECDGPFATLSNLYEHLLKKIRVGGTEKLKQSFLKWCER